jgi:hypothetical protein
MHLKFKINSSDIGLLSDTLFSHFTIMEATKENIRFLVESCRRNDMTAVAAHQFICRAWGDDSVSLSTVYRLFGEFASGSRSSVEDATRCGRPRSMARLQTVDIVQDLINEDPHITIEDLVDCTDASHGTIQRILMEDLHLQWRTAKWVPHFLSEDNKKMRVADAKEILKFLEKHRRDISHRLVITDEKWFYHRTVGTKTWNKTWISKDAPQPRTVKRIQYEAKTMVIVAFSFDGKFTIDALAPGNTVSGDCYINFLRHLIHNYRRRQDPLLPNNMVFMHDNARPHTSATVSHFLDQKGVTLLHQPVWSPDFNMLDRWVFTLLDRHRIHRNFEDYQDVKAYVTAELRALSPDDLAYQFQEWKSDLQHVIDSQGDYL